MRAWYALALTTQERNESYFTDPQRQVLSWGELAVYLYWKVSACSHSNVLVSCKTKPPAVFMMRDFERKGQRSIDHHVA